jgi:TolA-binding protein
MQSEVHQLSQMDQLLVWFDKNKKQATWGALAVALIGLAVGLYVWRENEVQNAANEALSKVLASATPTQGVGTDALLKVASDHAGTEAAKRAVLMAAGDYFDQGKYKEAQAQFDRFLRDYRESPFSPQALLGVAACKDALGMTNDAVNAYKDIADRHGSDSIAPQAKLALARLYEAQGKLELARDYYMQVAQADPNGAIGSDANMSLAELFSKNPNLIPQRAAPMTAPLAAPAAPAAAPAKK